MPYRQVHDRFWTDPDITDLDPDAKLLALYLFTTNHGHLAGIYPLRIEVAALDIGVSVRRVDTLFHTLCKIGTPRKNYGFMRYDEVKRVVWVVNMFRNQGKAGSKILSAAAAQLLECHKSSLVNDFCVHYPAVVGFLPADFDIPATYPIQYPNGGAFTKEKEKEKDTEVQLDIESTGSTPTKLAIGKGKTIDDAVVALYHDILPELPGVKVWTKSRAKFLHDRISEDEAREAPAWWKEYFLSIRDSDFLMSPPSGDRHWRPDLEWLIRPKNFLKALEGKYETPGRKEERLLADPNSPTRHGMTAVDGKRWDSLSGGWVPADQWLPLGDGDSN